MKILIFYLIFSKFVIFQINNTNNFKLKNFFKLISQIDEEVAREDDVRDAQDGPKVQAMKSWYHEIGEYEENNSKFVKR